MRENCWQYLTNGRLFTGDQPWRRACRPDPGFALSTLLTVLGVCDRNLR
jgi:hypothetical protein